MSVQDFTNLCEFGDVLWRKLEFPMERIARVTVLFELGAAHIAYISNRGEDERELPGTCLPIVRRLHGEWRVLVHPDAVKEQGPIKHIEYRLKEER